MKKALVAVMVLFIIVAFVAVVVAETSPISERFKILLGEWEHNDRLRYATWKIEAINEEGIVEIDYKQGYHRSIPATATVRQDEKGNLYLNINAPGVVWDLQYYNIFGGMFNGQLRQGGYFLDVKVYRLK